MKMQTQLFIMFISIAFFSCNDEFVLYEVVIKNNSSETVSGIIKIIDDQEKSFTVSTKESVKINVTAPYTVSFENQFGRIKGAIDYDIHEIVFTDNIPIILNLTNIIDNDVYIFTGGYIQGEIPTQGEYKIDGTEGFKVDGIEMKITEIYTLFPSFNAITDTNIKVRVLWTIDLKILPPAITGIITY